MNRYAISASETAELWVDGFPVAAIVTIDPHVLAKRRKFVEELAKDDPELVSITFRDKSTEFVPQSELGEEHQDDFADDEGLVEIRESFERQDDWPWIAPSHQSIYPDGEVIWYAYENRTGVEIVTSCPCKNDEQGLLVL